MSQTLIVQLKKPMTSIKLLDSYGGPASSNTSQNTEIGADTKLSGHKGINSAAETQPAEGGMQDLERQKAEFAQVCQTLNSVVNKMSQFYDEMLTKHREEIAKLSVEIANKVLMQKVQKGDYQIESIIKEALKNAPTCQEVVVHLNPEDLAQYQKLQQDDPSGTLTGIKFVADPAIGRAECLLETPKGIVKSFVEQHLEQISEALSKVE